MIAEEALGAAVHRFGKGMVVGTNRTSRINQDHVSLAGMAEEKEAGKLQ